MTDKDFRKLSREDLLKLMLTQGREVSRQKAQIADLEEVGKQTSENLERMKRMLEEKDQMLDWMKERLSERDERLEKLTTQLDNQDALLQVLQEGAADSGDAAKMPDTRAMELQAENDALRERLAQMSGLIAQQNATIEKQEEELRQLQERVTSDTGERSAVSLENLDLLIEEFNEKNRLLKSQLEEKEAQLDAVCRKEAEHESFVAQLREQVKELQAGSAAAVEGIRLEDLEAFKQELRGQLEELRAGSAAAAEGIRLEDLEAFKRELRGQLEELRAGSAAAAEGIRLEDLEAFKQELRGQLDGLRDGLSESSGAADPALKEQLREKEQRIDALNAKLEQRDNEIRDLWGKIWSLVAPKN